MLNKYLIPAGIFTIILTIIGFFIYLQHQINKADSQGFERGKSQAESTCKSDKLEVQQSTIKELDKNVQTKKYQERLTTTANNSRDDRIKFVQLLKQKRAEYSSN